MHKRVPVTLNVKEYLIKFTYYKRNGKFTESSMLVSHINRENAKETFLAWCKKQRTMSKVSILDVVINSEKEPKIIEV